MHRRHDACTRVRSNELTAMVTEPEARAQERPCRDRAQREHDMRFDQIDLSLEPRPASLDFNEFWLLMNAAFAALDEFEMFDRVGHIDVARIQACSLHGLAQQAPGWPDEHVASEVFDVARHFADEHDRRPHFALAEDGLRGVLVEIAAMAICGSRTQGRVRLPRRQVPGS